MNRQQVMRIRDSAEKLLDKYKEGKQPKTTKAQVERVRDSADRLLKAYDSDKKSQLDQLTRDVKDNNKILSDILRSVDKDTTNKQLIEALRNIQDIKVDTKPLEKNTKQLISAIEASNKNNMRYLVGIFDKIDKSIKQQGDKKDRTDDVVKAIKNIKLKTAEVEFPESISIDNFPPTKTPTPVTNININPLRGTVHQTTTTVSTTLTKLPDYGELDNRRSIIFYNNDSTNTVFIGGSTVTTANGMPVEAQSFSPSFDSGPLQKWYGVTSASTADIRTIELANDTGA